MKKLYYLTALLLSFSFFIGCELEEEDDYDDYDTEAYSEEENENEYSSTSTWQKGYWIKQGGGTYLDLNNSSPEFCSNGTLVGGTYSNLRWESSSIAFFTLYNAGDEVDFRIEKNGDYLILAPWDDVAKTTHDPATYSKTSNYPCANSSSNDNNTNNGNSSSVDNTTSTVGNIAFYTTTDKGCGNITITVDGNSSKVMSQYYSQGISSCSDGTVFNLSVGTHSYKAECSSYYWEDTFTITPDGCLMYELR